MFIWTTPCRNIGSVEHLYSFVTGKIESTQNGGRRWTWEDETHLRRLTSAEATAELTNVGFEKPEYRFRAHFFSFICENFISRRLKILRNYLFTLDYRLFRRFPNGASMIGVARKL